MSLRGRRAWAALTLATASVSGCGDSGTEPPAGPSGPQEPGDIRVVFSTPGPTVDPDGHTVTLDGSRSLTANTNGEVVFTDVAPGPHQIEVTDVATNCAIDGSTTRTPSVAGDGSTATVRIFPWCIGAIPPEIGIVFVTGDEGENRGGARGMSSTDLAGLQTDGTGEIAIVEGVPVDAMLTPWAFADPTWSPDGSALLFVRDGSLSEEIWLAQADGSEVRHIATGYWPTWSPDGQTLAFLAGDPETLFTINVDGSGLEALDLPGPVLHVAWSPTESKLAVAVRNPAWGPGFELGIVNADGSSLTRVGSSSGFDRGEPTWSPDGTRIAYRAGDAGGWSLRVVGADGSDDEELFVPADQSSVRRPAWSPGGDKVLFSRYVVTCGSNGLNACAPDLYTITTDGSDAVEELVGRAGPAEAGTWRGTP